MKIVALGASSSTTSINKVLATYAAEKSGADEIVVLDLNDYELPIFSVDRERENGIPQKAIAFKQELNMADGVIISFAEHNGAYTAAFKNIFDWISRIEKNVWHDKPMLLLATSPGKRGGRTVLEIAVNKFKFMNNNTIRSFSLPLFNENFSSLEGISNADLKGEFEEELQLFVNAVKSSITVTSE